MKRISIWASLLLLVITGTAVADVIKMDREEVIQRSSLIFTGQVLEKSCRWNEQGNMILTDYKFRIDRVLFGETEDDTITLTFAGGQMPEEGQSVSCVPTFAVMETVLLMVENAQAPLLSPVTGMYQGKFKKLGDQVVDDHDHPVRGDDGKPMTFDAFVAMVANEIPIAKAKPTPDRTVPEKYKKYVQQELPSLRYDAAFKRPQGQVGIPGNGSKPRFAPQSATPGNHAAKAPSKEIVNEKPLSPGHERWSYSHRAKSIPITFNPWPDSFPEWIRTHDQYALAYWNDYADIYRVMTATGTWAWGNDQYDMAGFVDNQTMIDQFGSGWGSSTLAVCWLRWGSDGFSVEADIAMNPAFSWTTTDYDTYDNSNLYNADRTLTHEVGHSWGLNHQFEALSVMNYAPKKYRAYNILYLDDVAAVKSAFPSAVQSIDDIGVSLFYDSGYQDYDDSDLSQLLVAGGDSVTVSNFIIENCGTSTQSPVIDWYLCPNINDWTGAIYVQQTTHSSLSDGSFFNTSRTLTIPTGVPDGLYYLGAFVRNSGDAVSQNDSSWLDRMIQVDNTEPPVNDNWFGTSLGSTLPVFVEGTNEGATTEDDEPDTLISQATVWWYFPSSDFDGAIRVSTAGSNFDTVLDVYNGTSLATLSRLATNDDFDGRQSQVTLEVSPNTFYDIRVGGYNGATGDIDLTVSVEWVRGDLNGDGALNTLDVSPFVLAILDRTAFDAAYPDVDADVVGDFNDDSVLNSLDISFFVNRILGN